MRKFAIAVSILLVGCTLAWTQETTPKADVFGGYSLLHTGGFVGDNASGWNASITGNLNRWFGLTADLSGHYDNGAHDHNFLFGPTVSYRQEKITPFAHLLLGGSHASGFGASDNAFAWALGGGADWNATPRVAVRLIQADFLQTHFASDTQNNGRFSFGVVFHF
jgi:opacity protein-like surface antigen